MFDLKALAVRNEGPIRVSLSGHLPSSCYTARVKDKYPGGGIYYVKDPGVAQILIEETLKPAADFCILPLMPWADTVTIHDSMHTEVAIAINDRFIVSVPVIEGEPKQWDVIALTVSSGGNERGCSIVPSGAPYPAIYSRVFGPASKEECEKWRKDNCTAVQILALDGSGDRPFPW